MRLSVTLLIVSLFGMVGGAWLIGLWCVGLVVVVWSLALAVFALLRDDAPAQPQAIRPGTEEELFRRRVVESVRDAA